MEVTKEMMQVYVESCQARKNARDAKKALRRADAEEEMAAIRFDELLDSSGGTEVSRSWLIGEIHKAAKEQGIL